MARIDAITLHNYCTSFLIYNREEFEIVTEFKKIFAAAAREIGIALSAREVSQFDTYRREILIWNEKISLVSAKSIVDLPIKHCIDSLTAVKLIAPECVTLLDIGAGAGFPGIPLKIVRSSLKLTLVDSHRKKVTFLKNVALKLKLTDIVILNRRIESFINNERHLGMYDVVISRATFGLSQYISLGAPFLSPQGVLIAMKGRGVDAELEVALDIANREKLILAERHELDLPVIGDKRILLAFKRSD
ncbi:MAG: 16S rRNA (guanine(527)-N(7))-methyltransferase RsmG [Deltaproteobacteria bacterium]|nr:16S rRNA (guanine(527)-N(7))-methyltransferase RsmG [Deltaproteobacteria bacterium]